MRIEDIIVIYVMSAAVSAIIAGIWTSESCLRFSADEIALVVVAAAIGSPIVLPAVALYGLWRFGLFLRSGASKLRLRAFPASELPRATVKR